MFPRVLSLSFFILVGVFSLAPHLHAGASNKSGNPFGNGTFFSDAGTFSAILRDTDFLGVIQFSTSSTNSSTNSLTNAGIASIYASGFQYTGSAFGTINTSAQSLAVNYTGVNLSLTQVLPSLTSTPVQNAAGAVIGFSYNSSVTNFSSQNTVAGNFQATLRNSYPNQVFSGNGTSQVQFTTTTATLVPQNGVINSAYYNYNPIQVTTLYRPTVQGTRLNQ